MTTYDLCKRMIQKGATRASMLPKLDVFLLINRISTDQYNELVALLPAE